MSVISIDCKVMYSKHSAVAPNGKEKLSDNEFLSYDDPIVADGNWNVVFKSLIHHIIMHRSKWMPS